MRNIFTLVTVALLLDGGTIFAAGNSNHHGAVFVGNTTTDKSKSASQLDSTMNIYSQLRKNS